MGKFPGAGWFVLVVGSCFVRKDGYADFGFADAKFGGLIDAYRLDAALA